MHFSTVRGFCAALLSVLVLSACVVENDPTSRAATGDPERDLRTLATNLSRTVLESTTTAVVITPFFVGAASRNDAARGEALRQQAQRNAQGGAVVGAYVAFLQYEYATDEQRLERVREDLNRSSREMQTAINVMREVLDKQKAELAALRAQGDASSEVAEANGNLAEMQKAIEGARRRAAEFEETRSLGLETADPALTAELDSLSARVAAMRQIAGDLAREV